MAAKRPSKTPKIGTTASANGNGKKYPHLLTLKVSDDDIRALDFIGVGLQSELNAANSSDFKHELNRSEVLRLLIRREEQRLQTAASTPKKERRPRGASR